MFKAVAILSTIMAVAASSSALAFRDESQNIMIWRAMQAKRAQQIEQAKREEKAGQQPGMAGPTGVLGRVDRPVQTNRNRRDPTAHP